MKRVVVSGLGPVSAIGIGKDAYWQALLEGRAGFGPVTLFDASRCASRIAAEVKNFRLSDYIADARLYGTFPRPTQLAIAAAALALKDAGLNPTEHNPQRFGAFVGTSIGNLAKTLEVADKVRQGADVHAHSAFHVFAHSAACVISSIFDIQGPIHTTTTGCNAGVDALGVALRSIQTGVIDVAVVVGTDCEVDESVMQTLSASNSLSTKYNDRPSEASRPFDVDRDGNVVGEGAGAIILESEEHAMKRMARTYALLAGYALCSAGNKRLYSHDRPEYDPRSCVRAIEGAMKEAQWQTYDVDVINANGSSSVLYDRIEAKGLLEVFKEHTRDLRVHSTKSMLGQHGAGSSSLQAIAACLSLRNERVFGTINHKNPDPECKHLRVITESETFAPNNILMHSIGLGGFYYSSAAFTRLGLRSGAERREAFTPWAIPKPARKRS